ncbi:MAG TPA: ribonuclease E/G [Rhizomicrobium sp.]
MLQRRADVRVENSMPKRMLIDASHPEETRVVVLDGQKVEEFDFEAASKRPLKGNIYLAKVTRVEPSLQAAFVEYGGNRQGFLAFGEIHPDYYQIPVADRQALIAEQQAEARRRAEEEFEPVETGTAVLSDEELAAQDEADARDAGAEGAPLSEPHPDDETHDQIFDNKAGHEDDHPEDDHEDDGPDEHAHASEPEDFEPHAHDGDEEGEAAEELVEHVDDEHFANPAPDSGEHPETPGFATLFEESRPEFGIGDPTDAIPSENGETAAEAPANGEPSTQPLRSGRPAQRWMRKRHYKIQEVIKRRQIILVQVVKEERGNKGAALTTYLSLAGRYCVLMPNTPRGGGISRKITNASDRKRLKSAAATLELPEGMGLIIRTAGENRTKVEIKRDYEYLLRMWDTIRETTLNSNAPACVYEEGDLIKRAIRDLYNKDVADIVVEGDDGYRNAKDFMRMLMPSHAKNVKQYKEPVPLFQGHHIEAQLDAMFQPTVTLKSGGYIVINQTEALVSIDVNSGRATREHSIEETAHKTNLEAADEIGRQLRLRDLAGLIVIDFIDMEDSRNDRHVEKRLRDAVKNDRARIQIGKISQFGLLEMSRQRLRAGVVAGSTVPCPHCGGQGIVRSVESTALRVLRGLEEEGQKLRSAAVTVRVPGDVAIYTLNQKRRELQRIETDYRMAISFLPKEDILAGNFEVERTAQLAPEDRPTLPAPSAPPAEETFVEAPTDLSEEVEESEEHEDLTHAEPPASSQQQPQQSSSTSHRRRRRRGGRGRGSQSSSNDSPQRQPQHNSSQHIAPEQQRTPSFGDERFGGMEDGPDTTPEMTEESTQSVPSQSVPSQGTQQGGSSSSGESGQRRRRRRRRGGRSHSSSTSPTENGAQHAAEHPSQETAQLPETNDASDSGWSQQADEPPTATPELPTAAPVLHEAAMHDASEEVAEAADTPRRGWWQRTFRS